MLCYRARTRPHELDAVGQNGEVLLGSAFDTVLGFALYLAIVAIGWCSMVASTIFVHRRLKAHGTAGGTLTLVTVLAGIGSFLGLWLVFDLYWIARSIIRLVQGRPAIR